MDLHFTPLDSGAPRIWQRGATTGGPGVNSFQQTFFIEKGRVVSAVTTDNAKVFSQLMSKSRSLAEISEKRLQPLLV